MNKTYFHNDYMSKKSSPLILGTKDFPRKLNHSLFIDVSERPNAQTSFKSRNTNLMPNHNENVPTINITYPYKIIYPFFNGI